MTPPHLPSLRSTCQALATGLLLLLTTASLHAQNLLPFEDYGWGFGMDLSVPTVADIDGNGRLDLLVGINAQLVLRYEQDAPGGIFRRLAINYANIVGNSQPAPYFTDLDSDGLLDILVGINGGSIIHFEQYAAGSDSITHIAQKLGDIDIGACARPFVVDLDGNGLLDLLVGESGGPIKRFEQTTPNTSDFTQQRDLVIPAFRSNYAHPCLRDIDNDGALEMLVGSTSGAIQLHRQSTAVKDSFVLVNENWSAIVAGGRSAPTLSDLDGDALLDVLIGTSDGAIKHYEQPTPGAVDGWVLRSDNLLNIVDFGSDCTSLIIDLDNDGRIDILRTQVFASRTEPEAPIQHFRQISVGSLQTEAVGVLQGVTAGEHDMLSIIDIEDDGRLDLIVARSPSGIEHYRQLAGNPFAFELVTLNFIPTVTNTWTSLVPYFCDLDNNGKKDLLLAFSNRRIDRYEQQSSGSTSFELREENFLSGLGFYPSPSIEDIDNDGLLDMMIGQLEGDLRHFEQSSTDQLVFEWQIDHFQDIRVGQKSQPTFVDINKDGRMDLVISDGDGGLSLYLDMGPNEARLPTALPAQVHLLDVSPNPVTDQAVVRITCGTPSNVTLRVCDLLGREVARPATSHHFGIGTHNIDVDVRDLPAGAYLMVMDTDELRQSLPLIKLRY